MPPAVDEQQEAQHRMMNFMTVFMGFLFWSSARWPVRLLHRFEPVEYCGTQAAGATTKSTPGVEINTDDLLAGEPDKKSPAKEPSPRKVSGRRRAKTRKTNSRRSCVNCSMLPTKTRTVSERLGPTMTIRRRKRNADLISVPEVCGQSLADRLQRLELNGVWSVEFLELVANPASLRRADSSLAGGNGSIGSMVPCV